MKGVHGIVGRNVILRPYLRMFVEKYHAWMVRSAMVPGPKTNFLNLQYSLGRMQTCFFMQEDPVLRELTASEPLTLEASFL